jgi:nitrate reductase gamma subunit
VLYLTDLIFLGAVTFLFLRRVIIPQMRYISLAADYFPLFLIGAIGASGVFMRYFLKTDVVGIKELTMGLVTFHPIVPKGIGTIFYIHLFLVSALFAYFPLSKLMHMAGVFLSPTRNLVNNNRAVMHVNPWNYPVKVHTYEEYEEDFREKMKAAGLPVEKE